jgi:hypothetical protein
MELKASLTLEKHQPETFARLKHEFQDANKESQETLTKIVYSAAQAELATLINLRNSLQEATTKKLYDFFNIIHQKIMAISPGTFPDFDACMSSNNPSSAVSDYLLSRNFTIEQLNQLHYEALLEETSKELQQRERQEARNEADALELYSSSDILVAQLVEREINRKIKPLNREINALQNRLNGRASLQGTKPGAKMSSRQTTKKTNVGDPANAQKPGENARNNTKKPRKPTVNKQNAKITGRNTRKSLRN